MFVFLIFGFEDEYVIYGILCNIVKRYSNVIWFMVK